MATATQPAYRGRDIGEAERRAERQANTTWFSRRVTLADAWDLCDMLDNDAAADSEPELWRALFYLDGTQVLTA